MPDQSSEAILIALGILIILLGIAFILQKVTLHKENTAAGNLILRIV